MNFLVIRHAIAEDREAWALTGVPDEQRPLTDEGRKKMKRAVRGLERVVERIDVLATSPWVRAVQTAEIVARRYDDVPLAQIDQLLPDRQHPDFLDWLKRLDQTEVVAVVGHEPHLSELISWLLTARVEPLLELKKGAACMLSFPQAPEAGKAKLVWLLTPAQLRRIGGS